MLQTILLRRANKVLLPAHSTEGLCNETQVATFNLNLQDLGYTFSSRVLTKLQTLSLVDLTALAGNIIPILAGIKGVKNYRPMYPNFPQQVVDAPDAELYLNALYHYFTVFVSDVTGQDCIWLPKYHKNARDTYKAPVQYTVLHEGGLDDVALLAAQLATSNTSISKTDFDDLGAMIDAGVAGIPMFAPHKEITAFLGKKFLARENPHIENGVVHYSFEHLFKTATDVLRLAVAMSDGDISLADNTKFRSFSRRERRAILSLLENNFSSSTGEDMLRHKAAWLRLGERLHPGEFVNKFPKVWGIFGMIRNGDHIQTFNSDIEKFLENKEINKLITALSLRPGVFARRLDHVLRLAGTRAKQEEIIEQFRAVGTQVSTPVLLQAVAHFQHRNTAKTRLAFPKGSVAKAKVLPLQTSGPASTLLGIDIPSLAEIACSYSLIEKFKTNPKKLGKVYVDPALASYLVPFSQRSASKAIRTLVRGSQIPLGDQSTVRFFIWWKNLDDGDRVDVDLSAVLYDENWNNIGGVSYFNLRWGNNADTKRYSAVHSGDITDAPKGACEFIDISIDEFLDQNKQKSARYVTMLVNSYTGQQFSNIPEASAGWMMRDEPNSGEVFEAKTVSNRIDLTSAATSVIPIIIDLIDRKIIWADIVNQQEHSHRVNNSHTMRVGIKELGKALCQITKPTLYDLFSLHAQANTQVYKLEEADTVFSTENGIQFETERIMSEFLK